MNIVSTEIITVLQYLIPGLLTSKMLESLLPTEEKKEFTLLIESLIYTVIINVIVKLIKYISISIGSVYSFGVWNNNLEIILSIIVAILFSIITSYILNNDIIHSLLRNKSITRETSYIKGWYGAFSEHNSQYIVLHLKDERRIMGLPTEWTTKPDEGIFQLKNADWLLDNKKTISLVNVDTILIKAQDVLFIEFVKNIMEEEK